MKPSFIVRTITLSVVVLCVAAPVIAQTNIGNFTSVTPTVQTQNLVIPSTHRFQRLVRAGDVIAGSGGQTVGSNSDFTGYVPIAGSSRNGYLSISAETTPAACAIMGVSYSNTNHLWTVGTGGNVPFLIPTLQTASRFCSGTVTPNGTIMVSEESMTTGDNNADGYTDVGWIIEINPATRTVINQDGAGGPDKLWAIGRASRENACIKSDNTVLYTGADDGAGNSFLYKFVPTVPGNFSAGTLYGLRTTAGLGNGTWKIIPNTTQAHRNGTTAYAASSSGGGVCFSFNGIEDVEFGPDGRIYFAAKNEGKIYRFTDNGTVGTATDISGLEVFAGNSSYPTIRTYDIDGAGGLPLEPWGLGNDNLAFDGDGNLWVCQDAIAGSDRNHIWVIGPTHTQASPQVRVFATTPTRSEPTGITFTPDYKFMFISFMSPNGANSTPQTDAAGTSVIFNTHTTVVIGRLESLGNMATLAANFTAFDAKLSGEHVNINWTAAAINNHDYFTIERSTDGINFQEIGRLEDDLDGITERSFVYTDNNLPNGATVLYYRIRQCDKDGECKYTNIKLVKLKGDSQIMSVYPQPAQDNLTISYRSITDGPGAITVTDMSGKIVLSEGRNLVRGVQSIVINTSLLTSGAYIVTIADRDAQATTERFIKE
jgi:uncharacterized protein